MPKKTDMAGLRDLAKTFLHFEPVSTPFAPVVIKHPFTDSALVGIRQPDGSHAIGNILDSQEDMQAWRKQQSEVIDRVKSPLLFAFMVTNSYALGFLKYAQQYLSREDLSEMLAYIYQPKHAQRRIGLFCTSTFYIQDFPIVLFDSVLV